MSTRPASFFNRFSSIPTSATHRFIIGVDFGTTYTGVSYVQSNGAARDINVIQDWPGPARVTELVWKTPSRIAYRTENPTLTTPVVIGYQVTAKMKSYSWFKLKLDRTAATQFDDPSLSISEGEGVMRLPRGKSAREVCTDYLREIYTHTITILERRVSADILRVTPIEFWFTVPAIWSDGAKSDTLSAARAAGFESRPGDSMNLIIEPEAAGIAALTGLSSDGTEEQIAPNDGILICDCGGGTVDITTYSITRVVPELEFTELLIGQGGKCGSTYIDRLFLRWMSRTFGAAFDMLPFERKGPGSRFMRDFESVKRDFGLNQGRDETFEVTLAMPGVEDSEYYEAGEGLVKFNLEDLEGFFRPVVQNILNLLEEQLRQARGQSGRSINKIILVGGFGDSQYLLDTIKDWGRGRGVPRVICPDRPQAAIVRGAALRGLVGIKPKSRKLRSHYGFQLDLPYDPTMDDEDVKYKNKYDGSIKARGTMVWPILMGSTINEDTFIRQKVAKPWVRGETKEFVLALYSCSADPPPRRSDHPRVYKVGDIKVDLTNANMNKFKRRWMIRSDRHIYNLQYELQVMFGKREGVLMVKAKDGEQVVGTTQIEYAAD